MPLDTTPTRPQIRRGNLAPADLSLQPGVLALGYGQRQLHAGVPAAADPRGRFTFSDDTATQAIMASLYLPLSGGHLTGPLTLAGDPTQAAHAATKQYVDNTFFPRTGGIITGPLVVQKDNYPSLGFRNAAGTPIGLVQVDTPTGSTSASLVLQSAAGTTMWLLDTKIWVSFQGGPQYALLTTAGGTLVGPLILAADPSVPLQAATKQYVDARAGNYLPLTGGTLSGSLTVQGQLNVGVTAPYRLATTAKGNLLLGVAEPSQAATADATFGGTLFAYRISAANLSFNLYSDGTNWRYRAAGYPVAAIGLGGGTFALSTAPAGAPDAVANLTSALTVDAGGNTTLAGGLTARNVLQVFSPGGTWNGAFLRVGASASYAWEMTNDGNGVFYLRRTDLGSGNVTVDGGYNISTPGSLAANGGLYGGYVRSNGDLSVAGRTTTNDIMSVGGIMYVANNYQYYFGRDPNDGIWRIVQANAALWNVDTTGSMWNAGNAIVGQTLTVGGDVRASGSIFISAAQVGDFTAWRAGSMRYFQWQGGGWYNSWDESNGNRRWVGASGELMWLDGGGSFAINGGAAYRPGGGPWNAASDIRTHKDEADYTAGLDEVCALNPISFKYNGLGNTQDNGVTYIGLRAQEAQIPMPELVVSMDVPQFNLDGTPAERKAGILPGQLGTNLGPLSLALVNAVRELRDRVAVLEGAAR